MPCRCWAESCVSAGRWLLPVAAPGGRSRWTSLFLRTVRPAFASFVHSRCHVASWWPLPVAVPGGRSRQQPPRRASSAPSLLLCRPLRRFRGVSAKRILPPCGGTLWIVVNYPQRKAHHFNHFKCTARGTECTRGVGHHQLPPVSRIFSSSQIEPPSPLSPRSPALPRPGSAHRRQRQEARRRGRLAASSIRYLNKLNVFIKNPSPKPGS